VTFLVGPPKDRLAPCGKVYLVIIDVLGNLLVPFVSKYPSDIPLWNWKVDEYIVMFH
jgi:hypothetical protein